jgi:hypothetical protein
MKPEMYYNVYTTTPYLQQDETSAHSQTQFLEVHFDVLILGLLSVLFP